MSMKLKTICSGCSMHLSGDKTATRISHGLCTNCLGVLYPEFADEIINEMEEKEAA